MQSSRSAQRIALLFPTLAVTLALTAPLTAVAQTDPAAAPQTGSIAADGTGVARISLIQGTVSVQRGDTSTALAAALNAPVLGGDYLTTGDDSRSEIQFDGTSQLRIGYNAQLRLTQLDTNSRAVQLAQGTLELRLLQSTDGTSEIDTPSIAVKPQSHGAYRVSVDANGQTLVSVRSGRAEIDTPGGSQIVSAGNTVAATGAAATPSIQTVADLAPDSFDDFNLQRDHVHDRALADAAFVNPNIGGVEDLANSGQWVTDGSYGHVWVPASVGPDWAPYRDGRWVWEDGYGWTWVANESWGWAPYHYGSWYHSPNYGWAWDPPQPQVYVPWRPALVAFIGFGSGFGLSLGFGGQPSFGNIGWVPLAPSEPYHPWWGNRYGYGGNTTIVNSVTNVTNVTNITNVNVYRNVQYNGVTSVSSQRFLQGNFARNSAVSTSELQTAHVFTSAVPIVPTASNLRFTNSAERPVVAVRPALMQRSFAGNAAVVRRTAFVDQRETFAKVTHAPITPLHFKDAETTPLVPQRAATFAAPAGPAHAPATPVYSTTHDANAVARPVPTYAQPVHGTAGTPSDPWARFNASRTTETEHSRGTNATPDTSATRSTPVHENVHEPDAWSTSGNHSSTIATPPQSRHVAPNDAYGSIAPTHPSNHAVYERDTRPVAPHETVESLRPQSSPPQSVHPQPLHTPAKHEEHEHTEHPPQGSQR